ncbi:hypothetical protein FNF28_02425 [Cafeteria roenbergensis]|uniref:RRM domain-containing protein n=1 Tax=Cafeteria roenbergensis TaxID=33653 RepID=A0A5A8DTA6_CAFRO|nr:hypothetical protein FNF28_02425 [Cafeteria roenbergensis]
MATLADAFAAPSGESLVHVAATTVPDAPTAEEAAAARGKKRPREEGAAAGAGPKVGRRRKHLHGADLESDERQKRTLFLGNVPLHMTTKILTRVVVSALLGLSIDDDAVKVRVEAQRVLAEKKQAEYAAREAAKKEAEAKRAAKRARKADGQEEAEADDQDPEEGGSGSSSSDSDSEDEAAEEAKEQAAAEAVAAAAAADDSSSSSSAAAAAAAAPRDDPETLKLRREAAPRIESIRFRSVPLTNVAAAKEGGHRTQRRAAFIQGRFAGGESMNAYVVFKAEDDAVAARKVLHNAVVLGHHLRADIASGTDAAADNKRTVFVGQLPYDATEESVRALFASNLGGGDDVIDSVRVPRDRVTNQGKGIAYVRFVDSVPVAEALALANKGLELSGRKLQVAPCKRRTVTTEAGVASCQLRNSIAIPTPLPHAPLPRSWST